MENNREIKVKNKKWHWILDGISLLLILGAIGYTLSKFDILPESMPTHLNFVEFDSYGPRDSIFIYTTIAGIAFFILFIASNYFYQLICSFRNIKGKEVENYNMVKGMLKILAVEIVFLFSYMQIDIINSVLKGEKGIEGGTYLFIALIILITSVIYEVRKKKLTVSNA